MKDPARLAASTARDHRSISAEDKRLRTRTRLLDAALAACASDHRRLPSIEEVMARARVSRGTFYKYFESMDELLTTLGEELTRVALIDGERYRGVFTEKWKSTAVGLRLALTRARFDRAWAGFVVRTRCLSTVPVLGMLVLQDLAEGRASGEYHVLNDEVALDVLRGLLDTCIGALHRGVEDPEAYIDAAVHLWLQALGCPPDRCLEGMRLSRDFLGTDAFGSLHRLFDVTTQRGLD